MPRTVGWLAQWEEILLDPEQKIARPRQIYTGSGVRHLAEVEKATAGGRAWRRPVRPSPAPAPGNPGGRRLV